MPNRDVTQANTKLLNFIFKALNNNESVLFVISKVYDCINYDIYFKRNLGRRVEILKWFKSYLTERIQSCEVNGCFSDI